jgi:hypothetical protein
MNPRYLLALGACAATGAAAAQPRGLSDADLVAYAASPFDHLAMMEKHVTVGLNHGVTVVADFPCSDICPQYTTRIIHYDVAPGARCTAAGGVTQTRRVPYSIAMIDKPFCIPKALASVR